MNLKQYYFTENDCFKIGNLHTVKGVMVHSTGANNPYLKRYVGPDDGLLGKNVYNNHWNRPNYEKCVHAFIGKLQDDTIATYQALPWEYAGWHSGSGDLGKPLNANNTGWIGFEICEDNLKDKKYFDSVYKEAVELCAYLCKKYNLDPLSDILCHKEGHDIGIASDHGDVLHWFPKFGKTMNDFRNDVNKKIKGVVEMGGKYVSVEDLLSWVDSNAIELNSNSTEKKENEIKAGDLVVFKKGVTKWGTGSDNKQIASWARDGQTTFKVLKLVKENTEAQIGSPQGEYSGTAYVNDLEKVV